MKEKSDRAAWLSGGNACCNTRPDSPPKPYRFVLLGAPGVGKGTQAELLSERLGVCPLSTGDVFRAAKSRASAGQCSPAMAGALKQMAAGELVSDETVLALVSERVKCLRCSGGFLLDGFPRSVAQAEALEKILVENGVQLDAVLNYELPLETIVARLGGRRNCPNCKRVFHIETRPPEHSGLCDDCGLGLIQRMDDRPEVIRVRMGAYQKSTVPLIEFYRRKGLLVTIQAHESAAEIFDWTLEALEVR